MGGSDQSGLTQHFAKLYRTGPSSNSDGRLGADLIVGVNELLAIVVVDGRELIGLAMQSKCNGAEIRDELVDGVDWSCFGCDVCGGGEGGTRSMVGGDSSTIGGSGQASSSWASRARPAASRSTLSSASAS